MTPNEIITLVLSTIAILLSGFNTYITFFHKKSSFVGNILSFSINEETMPTPILDIRFECSLGNTGNRELLIRSIDVNTLGEEMGLIPIIESEDIPCVLKPDQITLIKFEFPAYFANSLSIKNRKINLDFEITASNGNNYIASKELKFIKSEHGLSLEESWKKTFKMKLLELH